LKKYPPPPPPVEPAPDASAIRKDLDDLRELLEKNNNSLDDLRKQIEGNAGHVPPPTQVQGTSDVEHEDVDDQQQDSSGPAQTDSEGLDSSQSPESLPEGISSEVWMRARRMTKPGVSRGTITQLLKDEDFKKAYFAIKGLKS
jgi:hypothetical protein